MKNLLIITTKLDAGGAERSLINFLNTYDRSRYKVELLLFKKEGALLKYIPKDVTLLEQDDSLFYMYNLKKAAGANGDFASVCGMLTSIPYIMRRVFATLYYRKILNLDRPAAEQQRWKHSYLKSIKKMDRHYDCAMAYLEGEPIYYLVDKVDADRKIGWIHNDYEKIMGDRGFDEKYFEKLDRIVTISDKCAEVLKKNFPKLSDKVVRLANINSAKVIEKLAEESYPDEYQEAASDDGNKKYVILSIGRLTPQKGFERIAPIARVLLGKGISFNWFILGDGELRRALETQVRSAGLEGTVRFLGVKDNPYPYIKNADVIVQTSLFEGKSVVIDEAKILHKKIVATKYDTIMDQIGDYPIKVVDYSAEEVAEAIKLAIIDDAFLENDKSYDNVECLNDYYSVIG